MSFGLVSMPTRREMSSLHLLPNGKMVFPVVFHVDNGPAVRLRGVDKNECLSSQ
jgi:hypothetical protein